MMHGQTKIKLKCVHRTNVPSQISQRIYSFPTKNRRGD